MGNISPIGRRIAHLIGKEPKQKLQGILENREFSSSLSKAIVSILKTDTHKWDDDNWNGNETGTLIPDAVQEELKGIITSILARHDVPQSDISSVREALLNRIDFEEIISSTIISAMDATVLADPKQRQKIIFEDEQRKLQRLIDETCPEDDTQITLHICDEFQSQNLRQPDKEEQEQAELQTFLSNIFTNTKALEKSAQANIHSLIADIVRKVIRQDTLTSPELDALADDLTEKLVYYCLHTNMKPNVPADTPSKDSQAEATTQANPFYTCTNESVPYKFFTASLSIPEISSDHGQGFPVSVSASVSQERILKFSSGLAEKEITPDKDNNKIGRAVLGKFKDTPAAEEYLTILNEKFSFLVHALCLTSLPAGDIQIINQAFFMTRDLVNLNQHMQSESTSYSKNIGALRTITDLMGLNMHYVETDNAAHFIFDNDIGEFCIAKAEDGEDSDATIHHWQYSNTPSSPAQELLKECITPGVLFERVITYLAAAANKRGIMRDKTFNAIHKRYNFDLLFTDKFQNKQLKEMNVMAPGLPPITMPKPK